MKAALLVQTQTDEVNIQLAQTRDCSCKQTNKQANTGACLHMSGSKEHSRFSNATSLLLAQVVCFIPENIE